MRVLCLVLLAFSLSYCTASAPDTEKLSEQLQEQGKVSIEPVKHEQVREPVVALLEPSGEPVGVLVDSGAEPTGPDLSLLTDANGTSDGPLLDASSGPELLPERGPEQVPEPIATKVPVFLASGQGARSIMSCDLGRTWGTNRFHSQDNADHATHTGKGLAASGAGFVMGLGWGKPGRIWHSTNGQLWKEVLPPATNSNAGVADVVAGKGREVMSYIGGRVLLSLDGGVTWNQQAKLRAKDVGVPGNVRAMGYIDGTYLIAGDGEMSTSDDLGKTWKAVTGFEAECINGVGRFGSFAANPKGQLISVGRNGYICTSTDKGRTWKVFKAGEGISGNVIWTGKMFYVIDLDKAWTSADGLKWTRQSFQTRLSLRRVAYGEGTFIAITRDGDNFYWSPDGIKWNQVPDTKHTDGTDLVDVAFTYLTDASACPKP